MTGRQKRDLQRALAAYEARYNPAERMVRQRFHSPGYHTTLRGGMVHPTRTALAYALALLDSGAAEHEARAFAILDRVLALQDTDPGSPTYGIWSWFLEEPLEQMAPPDPNWADFCGTSLIQIAMDHRERLPAELGGRLDRSLHHAARSIQRRNVGPGYTNIALMGAYVAYTVGEFYRVPDLLYYGRERLQRLWDYTRHHGAFTECNSPTYTAVAINVLARMRRDIREREAHPLVDRLYDLAWADVARHFHPPTGQWAGPHSRAYSTLLRTGTQGFLQRATGGAVRVFPDDELPPDLEAHRLDISCPAEHVPCFRRLDGPREEVQVIYRGDGRQPRITGRTYLDESVAIGSVNRGDFWNQRRPVLAYWGTAEHPIALRVQCLHDDYDYSSGVVFTRQAGPHILAAVVFATDHGDRHITLHGTRDGAIDARDLRLRFQIVNPPGEWPLPGPPQVGVVGSSGIGNCTMGLHVAEATFGDLAPRGEAGRKSGEAHLDIVFYSGEERRIDFSQLRSAIVVFGLQVAPTAARLPLPAVAVRRSDGRVRATWDTRRGRLELAAPERPAPFAELQREARGVDDA